MNTQIMPTPRDNNQPTPEPNPESGQQSTPQPGQQPEENKPPRSASGTVWKTGVVIAAVLSLVVPLGAVAAAMVVSAKYAVETQNGAIPEGIDKLEVRTGRATVTLVDSAQFGDRDVPPDAQATGWFDASYRQHKGDGEGKAPVMVQTNGSTAVLDVKSQDSQGVDVTIGLPEAVAQNLNVDVKVSGGVLQVFGNYKDIAASMTGGAVDVSGEAEKLALDVKGGKADIRGTFDETSWEVRGGEVRSLPVEVRKKMSVNVTAGSADLSLDPNIQPADGVDLSVAAGSADLEVPDPKNVKDGRGYAIVDDGKANLEDDKIEIEARRVADMKEVGKDIPLNLNAGAGDIELGYSEVEEEDESSDEEDEYSDEGDEYSDEEDESLDDVESEALDEGFYEDGLEDDELGMGPLDYLLWWVNS